MIIEFYFDFFNLKQKDDIKYLTPSLISSIKTYLIVKLGHLDLQEAKINKDYVIDRLLNDTKEIIRVLKLTSDENDSDKSNVIDIHSVKEKFVSCIFLKFDD